MGPVGTATQAPEARALLSDKETNPGQKLSRCGTLGWTARCQTGQWSDDPLLGVALVGTSRFLSRQPAWGEHVRLQPAEGRNRGHRALVAEGHSYLGPAACPVCGLGGGQDQPSSLLGPCPGWAAVCSEEGMGVGRSSPRLPLPPVQVRSSSPSS